MSIYLPKYIKKTLKLLIFLLLITCSKPAENSKNRISIERFEKLFYNSTNDDLKQLKKIYPYFFPKNFSDNIWEERLKDPIQIEIFNEIENEFETVAFLERGLFKFFKKHEEFFDEFNEPKVISVNTDVDYRNRIIFADSILLIGLDNYLGPFHRFYEGIPIYIKEDFTRYNIISDIAEKFAHTVVSRNEFYTFLDKIIYYGKILYYKDQCIVGYEDRYKIGYSKEKMEWAESNEYFVWTYFIENDILFDPNNKLNFQFINDAPFSRFYLEIDNQSSEMIGKFIGWKIIKSYMKNNDVTLVEMLRTKPIDIYNNSKYKPKK